MNELLFYLLEASLYLAAFALAYRLLFDSLTHFQWMRFYLTGSVLLSVGLPLLAVPSFLNPWLTGEAIGPSAPLLFSWQSWASPSITATHEATTQAADWLTITFNGLLILYALGVLIQAGRLGFRLRNVYRLIARHSRRKEGDYWVVTLPYGGPTFSFLQYVFLSTDLATLSADELQKVKAHEAMHVQQRHTYDRLLMEVAGMILWFNPLIYYLKNQLQEVQEYLADYAVGAHIEQRKEYAHLLLKLATTERPFSLATGFSDRQITRRILRLNQPRSSSQQKLVFASIIPLIAVLFTLSACLEEPAHRGSFDNQEDTNGPAASQEGVKIGQIRWQGNTAYDDETLTNALGLRPGDRYDSVTLNQHLHFSFGNPDQPNVSSLYMDQGHLFFSLEVKYYERDEGTVDLTMEIFEGNPMKIGQLTIQGNGEVPRERILAQIPIKSGELFSRAELIASQQVISEMGYFNPQEVGINPIPHPEQGTVDIAFTLQPRTTP